MADREELWAVAAVTPDDAMRIGLRDSDYARTGLFDGVPVAMGGINRGIAWLVTTDLIENNVRLFLRESRREIEQAMTGYERLSNYVDARNRKAIRWLRWLGFTIDDPAPYGVFGLLFHYFWRQGASQ